MQFATQQQLGAPQMGIQEVTKLAEMVMDVQWQATNEIFNGMLSMRALSLIPGEASTRRVGDQVARLSDVKGKSQDLLIQFSLIHVTEKGAAFAQNLENALFQLSTAIEESKRSRIKDPMDSLPFEISNQVLRHLGRKELLTARLVSSRWDVVVRSSSRFNRSLRHTIVADVGPDLRLPADLQLLYHSNVTTYNLTLNGPCGGIFRVPLQDPGIFANTESITLCSLPFDQSVTNVLSALQTCKKATIFLNDNWYYQQKEVCNGPTLTELPLEDLDMNLDNHEFAMAIPFFEKFSYPQLTSLELEDTTVYPEQLSLFNIGESQKQLSFRNVGGLTIGDIFGLIERSRCGPQLLRLDCDLRHKGAFSFIPETLPQLPALKYLTIKGSASSPVTDAAIERIMSMTGADLREVILNDCEIGKVGFGKLFDWCPKLEKLELRRCQIDDRMLTDFAFALRNHPDICRSLKCMDFTTNNFNPRILADIIEYYNLRLKVARFDDSIHVLALLRRRLLVSVIS